MKNKTKPPRDWFMIMIGLLVIYTITVSCCVVPLLVFMEVERWLLMAAR